MMRLSDGTVMKGGKEGESSSGSSDTSSSSSHDGEMGMVQTIPLGIGNGQ